jgi:hypothetical protein
VLCAASRSGSGAQTAATTTWRRRKENAAKTCFEKVACPGMHAAAVRLGLCDVACGGRTINSLSAASCSQQRHRQADGTVSRIFAPRTRHETSTFHISVGRPSYEIKSYFERLRIPCRCCSRHTPTPGQSRVASEIHLVYGVQDVVIDDPSVAERTFLLGPLSPPLRSACDDTVIRCLVVIDLLRAVDVRRKMTTSITGQLCNEMMSVVSK